MCSNICVYIYIHSYMNTTQIDQLVNYDAHVDYYFQLPNFPLYCSTIWRFQVKLGYLFRKPTGCTIAQGASTHWIGEKKTSNAESSSSTSKPEHWNKFLKAPHPTKKTLQIKCGIKTVSECHFNNFECIKGHFKKHPRRCESRDSKKVKQVVLSR